MGRESNVKNAPKLFVGDLVTFSGYHYTPDYLLIDEDGNGSLGIITKVKLNSPIGTMAYDSYTVYVVFWFASGRTTTEVSDHLKRISP